MVKFFYHLHLGWFSHGKLESFLGNGCVPQGCVPRKLSFLGTNILNCPQGCASSRNVTMFPKKCLCSFRNRWGPWLWFLTSNIFFLGTNVLNYFLGLSSLRKCFCFSKKMICSLGKCWCPLGKGFFPKTNMTFPLGCVLQRNAYVSKESGCVPQDCLLGKYAFPQYQCVELNFKLCSLRSGITLSFN